MSAYASRRAANECTLHSQLQKEALHCGADGSCGSRGQGEPRLKPLFAQNLSQATLTNLI